MADEGVVIGELLARVAGRLARAGIARPRFEARLLLRHASGLGDAEIVGHPERRVPAAAARDMNRLACRRAGREPMAFVVGEREFWGLGFRVSPASLIPRPDSETVVEAALAHFADRPPPATVLDLGTGTGCLLIALLSMFPDAHGLGIDISGEAGALARDNATALGVAARTTICVGDWASAIEGTFDLVVCNPPYVASAEIDRLAPDVRSFEPRRALDGGADGLAVYRALLPQLARLLSPGGVAVIELGVGQCAAVAGLAATSRLRVLSAARDLAGIERAMTLSRP